MNTHYAFKTKPYDHQLTAFNMSKDRTEFGYFMDMGTGKSKVAIDVFCYNYDIGKISTVVIVAPKGVYMNWVNLELPIHMPDRIETLIVPWKSAPRKKEAQALEELFSPGERLKILVVNVEALSTPRACKFVDRFIRMCGDCFMIVDESTTIKNHASKRTRSTNKMGQYCRFRRILSGEPVTKSPLDLYSQCTYLNWRLLGFSSYYAFRNRYAIMRDMRAGGRSFKQIVGYKRLDELGDKLMSFTYRIKKEECLDLPPKVYISRDVELTPEQKKMYESMRRIALAEIDGEIEVTAPLVITKLLRLHQIVCGHVGTDEGEVKPLENNRIKELIEAINESTGKSIIWATYRYNIRMIVKALESNFGKGSVVQYYGATSQEDRESGILAFQHDDKVRFFVGNPQTGGYGITLTAASNVIYYSNSYNLEHRLQSEDRAHRIGQDKKVTYIDLIARGTVDEKIFKALRAKKNIAEIVLRDKVELRRLFE